MPEAGSRPQTLLAFDFGLSRIGVAVGQSVTASAQPLAIISANNGKPDWPALSGLIDEWRPDRLLVGLPLSDIVDSQPMLEHAKRFARRLAGRYRTPVEMIDERYSSHEARYRRGDKGGPLDALAASVILEDWFAQQQ